MSARLCALCFTGLEVGEANICSFCAVAKVNIDSEEARMAEWARIYLGGVLIEVSQRISKGAAYLRDLADDRDAEREAGNRRMAALVRSQGHLLELVGDTAVSEEVLTEASNVQAIVDDLERPENAQADSVVGSAT